MKCSGIDEFDLVQKSSPRFFGDLPTSPAGVAFEATYGWGWFAGLLADLGLAAHMSHLKGTRAISSARVKNDAVDAETLAQLLRTNLLPEAWIAPPVCREARRLVRTRAALVRLRSRFKCQLLALLAEHGVQLPQVADRFGKEGRRFIQNVALTEQSQFCVTANLRVIDLLTTEVRQLEANWPSHRHQPPRELRNSSRNACSVFSTTSSN